MDLLCDTSYRRHNDLVGALLAGGRSRRLGQPKPLLDFGGRPLGLHLLSRLEEFCDSAVILANEPKLYSSWGYPVIPDIHPGLGPLAGLHAALRASRDEWVFLLACDLPFFPAELGALTRARATDCHAVIPRRGPYLEPLCAAYSQAALPVVETRIRTQSGPDLKVTSILRDLNVRYLDEADRAHLGPDEVLFLNINTPADLVLARRLWSAPLEAGAQIDYS